MIIAWHIKCEQPTEPLAQSSPLTNYTGYQNGNGSYQANNANPSTDPETNDAFDRGRSRKKRDFFGTLKRRLGRSKSRAKSLERQGALPIDAANPNGKNFNWFQFHDTHFNLETTERKVGTYSIILELILSLVNIFFLIFTPFPFYSIQFLTKRNLYNDDV